MAGTGALHHLELWVGDWNVAGRQWGWLLGRLGYVCAQQWRDGQSWRHPGAGYVVLEAGPDRVLATHDRLRPGMNHVAFWVGTREEMEELATEAQSHGWRLLFADTHPFSGGPEHCAAYLENGEGFEVELVAAHG